MKRLLLASVALCAGLGSETLAADFPPYAAPPTGSGTLLRPAPGGAALQLVGLLHRWQSWRWF
jgi:hypothetical protein